VETLNRNDWKDYPGIRKEASEIDDVYYEKRILFRIAKFEYGQWVVHSKVIDEVRSELRAAYAVAIAA